jgi:hypothetical protein
MRGTRRIVAAALASTAVIGAALTVASHPAVVSAGTTPGAQPTSGPSAPPIPGHTPTPSNTPALVYGGIYLGPTFTPQPIPAATPTPPPGTGNSEDSPGLFDVSGHVRQAIDDWFRNLVQSALDPVLTFLGKTILSTPDVADEYRVHETWSVMAGIANGVLILFMLAGAAIIMTRHTVHVRYGVKDVAPRLVVAAIAANVSLSVVGLATHFANALSQAFLGQGVDPVNATAAIRDLVLAPIATGGIFIIMLALVVAAVGVVLLVIYIARVALLVILVVGGPLALIGHALPQTEGIAQLWWRAVLGLLAVQVGQSLVLVTGLRVFFDSDHHALGFRLGGSIIDMLLCLCLLWVLMRIPSWVGRFVFSGSRHGGGSIARIAKYKILKAGAALL